MVHERLVQDRDRIAGLKTNSRRPGRPATRDIGAENRVGGVVQAVEELCLIERHADVNAGRSNTAFLPASMLYPRNIAPEKNASSRLRRRSIARSSTSPPGYEGKRDF